MRFKNIDGAVEVTGHVMRTTSSVWACDATPNEIYEVDNTLAVCVGYCDFKLIEGPDAGDIVDYDGQVYQTATLFT